MKHIFQLTTNEVAQLVLQGLGIKSGTVNFIYKEVSSDYYDRTTETKLDRVEVVQHE
jgi:hypothetical protein